MKDLIISGRGGQHGLIIGEHGFLFLVLTCVFHSGEDSSPENLLLHGPFSRKPKRIRTAFSPSQLLRLERAFEKNHYVVGAERKQLASGLCLTETQVGVMGGL